jgi:hypothetical protein
VQAARSGVEEYPIADTLSLQLSGEPDRVRDVQRIRSRFEGHAGAC